MVNVNFAPVNKNEQNFVNINTEIETDIDVSINKVTLISKHNHYLRYYFQKPCEFFDWLFGKCD